MSTTPKRTLLQELTSPAVVRAHANLGELPQSPPSAERQKIVQRIRRRRYIGSHRKDREFLDKLAGIAYKFPLCRLCLRVKGNICEHSHPIEADPADGRKIAVRALTACAKCNAAERESLRETCKTFGEHLRTLHVDKWPPEARMYQANVLARRIREMSARRARRILKID